MMNRLLMICLACAMVMAGCKKVSVDFTYSPKEPKAGEKITFTNNSSAGEKWAWNFGDYSTSISKNPTKIYKKPGTYLVTLMVDSAKYNTCSQSITVYDTVPTFVASTDSICHYQNVTLTANIYNPFKYALSYQWDLPTNCVLHSGSLTSNSIIVYFKSPLVEESVQLTIKQGDTTHPTITKQYLIHETKAPAILMQCSTANFRQRMIDNRMDTVRECLAEDNRLLANTTDTSVSYNDSVFTASNMSSFFPTLDVQRLQIDAMAQKWYITTTTGLFVANFSGQDLVLIDADATGALYVDALRNMLYWATPNGLNAMPLVKSKNNLFSSKPILYNNLSDIDRIVVNNDPL